MLPGMITVAVVKAMMVPMVVVMAMGMFPTKHPG